MENQGIGVIRVRYGVRLLGYALELRGIGFIPRVHTYIRTLASPIIQNQVFGPQWEGVVPKADFVFRAPQPTTKQFLNHLGVVAGAFEVRKSVFRTRDWPGFQHG